MEEWLVFLLLLEPEQRAIGGGALSNETTVVSVPSTRIWVSTDILE
jgi:hypothetical protein